MQYREVRFCETSESTNQRVLWWAIVQTAIPIVTGMWLMKHLRSFFEATKTRLTRRLQHAVSDKSSLGLLSCNFPHTVKTTKEEFAPGETGPIER